MSTMSHRSYQPLKPVTNRFLQQRWDHSHFNEHRRKVNFALPVVDNKGMRTPAHVQLKLKKMQLQEERLSEIDRDNRLLASKLTTILCSKGLVDHHNHYTVRSLNADRRREEMLLVGRQNQKIYERITSRQSEYSRCDWLEDWQRTEKKLEDISRYPRGMTERQRTQRKVKFAAVGERSTSRSTHSDSTRTDRDT